MITVEQVDAKAIVSLRAQILRPGLPLDEARYAKDDQPAALHLAACDELGHVVGCSTWFPERWYGSPAWRLRGMATSLAVRGSGVGGRLLSHGLALAQAGGAEFAWGNARTIALGFYRRYGFETRGEEFLTPQAIPHFLIVKPLR
jgi:predicted GNAT family N-acyltransferase